MKPLDAALSIHRDLGRRKGVSRGAAESAELGTTMMTTQAGFTLRGRNPDVLTPNGGRTP